MPTASLNEIFFNLKKTSAASLSGKRASRSFTLSLGNGTHMESTITGKIRLLKTTKRSKGTIVSRKSIPCSIFGSDNKQQRKRISQFNKRKSSEEKRTVIEKNRLINDQEFQTKNYSNSYTDQSNRRELTVDQWKRGEIKGMRRRPVKKITV
ncbi:hypothetical protein AVEN_129883-1 [Araneus ventricosus]|uniref:Uncharacterized protein n=1 Tax=Araneus ventricosus TaxID=182803 RepID=A0A4Y2VKP7_ARAVE|nr:hypothetical protein AVEN_129883-1 [Araneus ventricosus]